MDERCASFTLRSEEKGQEMVEFAIVLPLLLLIVFGVMDLGRTFHASITIANAAREGARFGIYYDWNNPGGYAAIESISLQEAQDSGLDTSRMDVYPNCGFCNRGDPLNVTVTYNFDFLMESFMPDLTLERSVTMMIP